MNNETKCKIQSLIDRAWAKLASADPDGDAAALEPWKLPAVYHYLDAAANYAREAAELVNAERRLDVNKNA